MNTQSEHFSMLPGALPTGLLGMFEKQSFCEQAKCPCPTVQSICLVIAPCEQAFTFREYQEHL
ncbi:hypothetical protein [Chthonobacter rhizosphaerae]|uniref:hypothetical protein n=1 Tax=Chthonobacter rhizosphaerae TaxID=2735553 RepID=UPI0015EEFF74|nr:hypothetical protein [Chthonobacter rhizosphaerae]